MRNEWCDRLTKSATTAERERGNDVFSSLLKCTSVYITVLPPCLPLLLFHARLHALFIHGPKPRLQAFFFLVGSTQFGDYYINVLYCSGCSINSAYWKWFTWRSLPPGWHGKASPSSSTQQSLSHLGFNITYRANTRIWGAPLFPRFPLFLWRKTKTWKGKRDTLTAKSSSLDDPEIQEPATQKSSGKGRATWRKNHQPPTACQTHARLYMQVSLCFHKVVVGSRYGCLLHWTTKKKHWGRRGRGEEKGKEGKS